MPEPLRVLIIEDSPHDADFIVRALKRGGYDVTHRRVDTEEGMRAALDADTWDVVLSDHGMPQFDATRALAMLRASGRDLPFIIVSGAIGEEMAVAIMKAGAHDYLRKEDLARLVPAVQRERRDARERHERRRLEREILDVAEREQRRIARDLHEGLGQTLAGLAFMAKDVEHRLHRLAPAEAGDLRKIGDLISQAVEYTRSLAKGLSPVEVLADGLMIALREFAASVEPVYHVPCRLECDPPVPIGDETVAMNLYYIAREAVHNAVRHAKPTQVVIRLTRSANTVTMTVRDDGAGFPPGDLPRHAMGLRLMQYRARMIGAALEFIPNPEGGTCVTCRLEWQPSA